MPVERTQHQMSNLWHRNRVSRPRPRHLLQNVF
jgi:hypothetical protein